MFDNMVISGYQYYTDEDIENFKAVGYITDQCYTRVKELRKALAEQKAQQTNQNSPKQTTDSGEQPQQ
ncbi:hypothetical protein [Apilactobacillus xinyiensis]|uniref:hypothetical protein n=1 Tax=Apilactobacillus xinyiensis TaxID=2841032 RepID=UPI001C7CDE97|nr:hypothetical protein [Apilactobacillus xinyiensis]